VMQKFYFSDLKIAVLISFLSSFIFLITSDLSYSQSTGSSLDAFLDSIGKRYGTNELLVNGNPYVQPDPLIKGNPYLHENKWFDAILYMAGNAFKNQKVKYNIVDEALVLKADIGKGKHLLVDVNKSLLDSFRMEGQVFVNASHVFKDKGKPRYYQLLHDGEVWFVRKFSKKFVGTYDKLSPRGKYSSLEEERYVIRDGEITRVNNRRSFIRFFPDKKRKQIRGYFREHALNYSKASYKELVNLSNFCFK
jgi:hypothetical protein